MPIVILLIWLLFDLIVWVVQGIIWMAGALIQLFVAFPAFILVVLGGAVLWTLLSTAAWGLLLLFAVGTTVLAVVAGHKYLKGTLRLRHARFVHDPQLNSSAARQVGRVFEHSFSRSGDVYMTPGEFRYGSTKSVVIDGHLYEVKVPGGLAPGAILPLNGRWMRSEVHCTKKTPDNAVLSIKLLAIE